MLQETRVGEVINGELILYIYMFKPSNLISGLCSLPNEDLMGFVTIMDSVINNCDKHSWISVIQYDVLPSSSL